MVTVDDNANIQRIIDVLKDDPAVFDEGKTVGLARKILFGDPNNNEGLSESSRPYIYVTIPDSAQQSRYNFGVSSANSVNQTSRQYKIVIFGDSRSKTQTSQQQLYDIVKNVRDSLQADPTFEDPVNPGTDAKFSRSIVVDDPWDKKTRGQLSTSISLILLVTIGQTSLINIPGIGDISILSETGDEGRDSGEIHNDDGDTKISKGANKGSRFFEYEYDTTLYESIQDIIDSDDELILTLKYPSGDRTYNAKLVFQRDSERFDGIKTVILQADKITI